MSFADIKAALPDYARDLKLNLSSILAEETLSPQQLHGTLVATALASRNRRLIQAAVAEAAGTLSDEAMRAAKAAAAIMGMNNVYYRFVHLASAEDYRTMPARLRMTVIGRPGVDKVDFELMSLAVSAINGCGMCIDSHEALLRKEGVSAEVIQSVIRIASVIHAIAATLDGEAAIAA